MKKLLGILVLGLLLSSCTTPNYRTDKFIEQDTIKLEAANKIFIGQNKGDFCRTIMNFWDTEHGMCYKFLFQDAHLDENIYYFKNDHEALGMKTGRVYVFKDATHIAESSSGKFIKANWSIGTLDSIYDSMSEAKKYIDKQKSKAEIAIEQKTAKKKVELLAMINEAKSTCKELGFKEDSDRFVDCALKLYTQKIDQTIKQKETVIVQTQASSGSMTIYDPVRDNQRMIDQGMKMLSGRCTLGIDC